MQVDDVNVTTTVAELLAKAAAQLEIAGSVINGRLHMYILDPPDDPRSTIQQPMTRPVLEHTPNGDGGLQELQSIDERHTTPKGRCQW